MSLRPNTAVRVPAEGGAIDPSAFKAGKTGTALRPVLDEDGNVTGYAEVQASRPKGITPKYLIGIGPYQGIVKPYNEVLAKNKNYRPSNVLPASHVQSAKDAAVRDQRTLDAQRAYAEQTKQRRIQDQETETRTLQLRRETLLAQPAVEDLQQQLQDAYHQIAAVEGIEELQEFCDANDLAIQLDAAEDLESMRATVRGMFEQHIEALAMKEAEKLNGGAEGEEGGDPVLAQARDLVQQTGKTNTSFLKQKLNVGFAKATELLEQLEAEGVVGPKGANGRREVLKAA